MLMPFGKYKGREIADLPDPYLRWLLAIDIDHDALREAIEEEHSRREAGEPRPEPPPPTPPLGPLTAEERRMLGEIVNAGYRTMAKLCHPDQGGEHLRMVLVNSAAGRLRAWIKGAR